jgi:outer membrane protein assembly factor BamA
MWISSALAFDLTDPQSWPFIPVPEIATDPNGGTTVGILPVFLFTDTKNQIRDIFAPDLNWNQTLGVGGTFRYLSYPSEDTNWYATAGGAQDIARQIDLDYQTGRTHQDLFTFEGRFFFERDPTDRFYGTGNNSSTSNETTYTTQQLYGMASVGLNISDKLQVQLMERPRWVRIQNGAYTSLPQIFQLFPHQKGINGGSEVLTQLMIQYDDRDSVDIPRSGGLYRVYGSVADRALGSSYSYTRFGYEARKYYTVHPRITLAGHVFMEYEPAGNEMPFWAQARLGGDQAMLTDQQPLRGFGTGRYIDNNLVVANIEMRNRVYDANLFGTHGTLEIAPFAEAGRVAHQLGYNPVSELHPVGGVGFRGIAEPFVVGFVDVGYGGQGAAIFSGINYPF